MRKNDLYNLTKDGLFYWFLILFISLFFLYLTTINISTKLLISVGTLNVVILETWFLKTFLLYSGRKISQYSEVIQRISFIDRAFEYFILPAIYLSTFMTFLYFNKDITMSYWMISLCMTILLILFLNIKSSLNKYYKISSLTKGIFDFVCIITFYLSINVLFRFDFNTVGILFLVGSLAMIMFISVLQLHDRLTFVSLFLSLISSVIVSLSIGIFIYQSIFVATAIGTLAFYVVISLWNIRFSGKYKFIDYLTPLLYGVIALILIFNL
jgi:hypothetical protein